MDFNQSTSVQQFCEFIARKLDLEHAKLDPAYYYQSLPLCVIDSVFSIGVRYEQVRNVIKHFCEAQKWTCYRTGTELPPESDQETISDFMTLLSPIGDKTVLFRNQGYANPSVATAAERLKKAELVYLFTAVLHDHGVSTFQSLQKSNSAELEMALKGLPTLSSGIVTRYFRMLAGDDSEVKPDRMIKRFIRSAGIPIPENADELAADLVKQAASILKGKHPKITPRLLDYAIWLHQRDQKAGAKSLHLKRTEIPRPDASWDEIQSFALTFNGYEYCGTVEKLAALANGQKASDLNELRACLFFEQRRWRHFGEEPSGRDLEYIRSIVETIRKRRNER